MKRILWSDWLIILVVLGFIAFLVIQVSCIQSAYGKRNRCVRQYLDYYTSGGSHTVEESLGKSGLKGSEKTSTTGYSAELLGMTDSDEAFERIAALCLLDNDELVQYIFETEYEPKEE